MALTRDFNRFLVFVSKHERSLGAGLFALGFLTDLFTFGLLPVEIVNWFFITYLILAVITVFGSQVITTFTRRDAWWRKLLAVIFPLGAQYAFGGLFSGFVVFYARSSVFAVSWPFLLLLALVYAGNEYFRMHKQHLVFQTVLLFFAIYAYAIFALPLFLGHIGPLVFVASTAVALLVFGMVMWTLSRVIRKQFTEHLRIILSATGALTFAVCVSYFSGLIPPIPLALVEEGVYHSVTKTELGYVVQKEVADPWWHLGSEVIEYPGGTVFVYSSVRAPISFSSSIVHVWQHYIPGRGWVAESKIYFALTGGRAEGYRGYSEKGNLVAGKWRVSVETPGGQVIGRIRFDIKNTDSMPVLLEEIR